MHGGFVVLIRNTTDMKILLRIIDQIKAKSKEGIMNRILMVEGASAHCAVLIFLLYLILFSLLSFILTFYSLFHKDYDF
jgi:hypothetical protein